jgi:membrane-bound lytic murein transglycosylase B
MQSIAQVKARLAMRARVRDTALVGSLGALAAGMCVFCALTIADPPAQVRPLAQTSRATMVPGTSPPPSTLSAALPVIPDQPVVVPPGVPVLALAPEQPDYVGPSSGSGVAATASGLAADGIPTTALAAYRHAAAVLAVQLPSCHLDWPVVAALGRVESNHGRFGGAVLTTSGVSVPRVRGPRLDGGAFALVRDTDGGRLDGDPVYDRAIGPLQFLPGTWRAVGADGNGDGVADPYNIFDAALGAGVYLCSGSTDLSDPASLHAAIYRYNHSDSYVALVLSLAGQYRADVRVVGNGAAPHSATPKPPARTTITTAPPATTTTTAPPTTSTTAPITTTTAPTTTVPLTTGVSSTPTVTGTPEPCLLICLLLPLGQDLSGE